MTEGAVRNGQQTVNTQTIQTPRQLCMHAHLLWLFLLLHVIHGEPKLKQEHNKHSTGRLDRRERRHMYLRAHTVTTLCAYCKRLADSLQTLQCIRCCIVMYCIVTYGLVSSTKNGSSHLPTHLLW